MGRLSLLLTSAACFCLPPQNRLESYCTDMVTVEIRTQGDIHSMESLLSNFRFHHSNAGLHDHRATQDRSYDVITSFRKRKTGIFGGLCALCWVAAEQPSAFCSNLVLPSEAGLRFLSEPSWFWPLSRIYTLEAWVFTGIKTLPPVLTLGWEIV